MKTQKATWLAACLAVLLGTAKQGFAVEIKINDEVKVDVGARMQLLGTFRNSVTQEFAPNPSGGTNRDFPIIVNSCTNPRCDVWKLDHDSTMPPRHPTGISLGGGIRKWRRGPTNRALVVHDVL